MKSIKQMYNIEKAELLCRLFPEELENMLNSIEKQCNWFFQNETTFIEVWQTDDGGSAIIWLKLVQDVYNCISNHRKELSKSPRFFANQLFENPVFTFSIYCLLEYTDTNECDYKLQLAIQLFFENEQFVKTNSIEITTMRF